MDVSSPLRSLVPSLDSAVLEVLSRTESSLGPTQIVRLAGRGSRPGIQLVLDRLAAHGLVLAEPTNRGHIYRLNRAHLLMPAVLAASAVRAELLQRLAALVQGLGPSPVHASLFGSFARGDGDEDSDIDLFLVMSTDFVADDAWDAQMRSLEDQVFEWTGNRLEILTLHTEGLSRAVESGERIVEELLADAVALHGPSVNAMVVRAGRPRERT